MRQVYEAAARRDTDASLPLYADDVVWDITHAPARELIAGALEEAMRDALRDA